MLEYNVTNMACGHCANAITEALKAVDADAQVTVDLDKKTVSVQSTAEDGVLRAAIVGAGYEIA